jgi:hypothetical protein
MQGGDRGDVPMKNKISVVLSAMEFARFDAYCAEKGFKKSTLIARLIREHLDRESFRVQGTLFNREPQQRPPPRAAKRPARGGR